MLNIINGKHVEASDKSTINIINPYTGRKIDTVPNSTAKDVKKIFSPSRKRFSIIIFSLNFWTDKNNLL